MNDTLRKECRLLKAIQNISYKELASYLEVKDDSFYSWLKGYFDFGIQKQYKLKSIIDNIKEY